MNALLMWAMAVGGALCGLGLAQSATKQSGDGASQKEQFVGAWYPLEAETQTSVGSSLDAAGQLGLGAVAGDEVWAPQARARLRIGPLPRARYDDFLPTGSADPALLAIARFFANDQVDFEVQLVLERDEVPTCVLGADAAAGAPSLGWCTWLKTKDMQRDPDETVFTM